MGPAWAGPWLVVPTPSVEPQSCSAYVFIQTRAANPETCPTTCQKGGWPPCSEFPKVLGVKEQHLPNATHLFL